MTVLIIGDDLEVLGRIGVRSLSLPIIIRQIRRLRLQLLLFLEIKSEVLVQQSLAIVNVPADLLPAIVDGANEDDRRHFAVPHQFLPLRQLEQEPVGR